MKLHIPRIPSINRIVLLLGFVCLIAISAGVLLVGAQNDGNDPSTASAVRSAPLSAPDKTRIATNYGQLPLSFELNKGQLNEAVKFMSHGAGYDLFLTANETVLRVHKPRSEQLRRQQLTAQQVRPQLDKLKDASRTNTAPDEDVREGTVLRLKLLGASSSPQVDGQDELPGKVNYFIGNDPEKWRRNVPTYRKAYFKDVYPGIDVVYYGQQRQLEYDFVVAAGANPKLIRFSVEGADQIRLDKTGKLLLGLKHGEVSLHKPVIYQLDENGSRREVKGAYVINGNEVRFKLQRFNSSKPLVIDPVLSYSTLLGSTQNDTAFGIAVDSQGSAYVTGTTDGTNFPTTPGSFKSTSTRSGAFVTKLNATGSSLIYSTYLNGVDGSTSGLGIAVDSAGNAYVTGSTSASDFPIVNGLKTTSNFFKTTDAAANWNNQNSGLAGNVFMLAVAPSAPNTIYAATSDGFYRSTDGGTTWTKMQGAGMSSFSFTRALAVDPSNASVVYLGNFSGLFKSTDSGSNWTAVTTAPLGTPNISAIVFDPQTASTMYVGSGSGVFKSTTGGSTWITQNNFGIAGIPSVSSFAIDPTTPLTIYAGTFSHGLFKSTNGGGVWTAMNNGMGGSNPTFVNTVVIDPANTSTIYTGHGNSFNAGGINQSTNSGTSWTPLTNGVPNNGITAMVATPSAVYAAINGGGIIKTTNGGTSWTGANTGLWSPAVASLVKDPANAAVIYAGTSANGFSDAFVTKLNASGSGILFSTLVGGSREENGNGIAVDGSGNITIVGDTKSSNFPISNAVRSTVTFSGNCGTAFVTKLNPAVPSYTFSTYLGGPNCDVASSVATDSSGNVYVTGRTGSPDFPTANAFQPNFSGSQFGGTDAFVSKLTPGGSLIYSTYLGSIGSDFGFGIAADSSGNAYVTGSTGSGSFPTANPIHACTGGDVFVTKFNSSGSSLVYSTCIGGGGTGFGTSIAVDSANNAYVTGGTGSTNFPLVPGALRTRSALYKSLDGAATWSNDNYGLGGVAAPSVSTPLPGATAVAIHPTQTSTVYAATAAGVFKSTNGGRTWSAMNNGLPTGGVGSLIIDPATPSTLYAAAGSSSSPGVYKSIDGGATWNRRSDGLINSAINSLVIDPATPNTLYVAVEGCCTGIRIFKTTDGADNWAPIGSFPPLAPMALTIDPLNPATLYVADLANPGAVFKTTNSGTTWQPLPSITFARSIAVSPHTAGVVYAGTDQGILKSTDGGNSWTPFTSKGGKIVFDPVSSSTLYWLTNPSSFTPEGLFKSTDNGQTWIAVNKGLNTPQAVVLAIDPLKPSTLYLASMTTGGFEGFVTKINPAGSALIYSTYIGGSFTSQNFNNVVAQGNGIALDASGNAYITGNTTAPGFLVTPDSFQPFNRGFSDAFVAKLSMSHIISGQVLDGGGLPVSGAEIVLNDGTSLTSIVSEGDGSYQFSRLRQGGTFTVTASKPHFTMAPASQTFNNLNSDQVLNFTATATNAAFHTISGQVTENSVALAGVTVTLGGSQPGLRTTDSNGNYSFELAAGGSYTVTPSLVGFNFGPTSQTFNNLSANQTANFAATRQSFVVTNANNHGAGSLREALVNANATVGKDTIVFNIPGPGVKTINVLNALPEITDSVVIDATTQPGYAGTPLVEVDGAALTSTNGLVIKAGGSTVRGLAIGNFRDNPGIVLNGCDNNIIQANYLGVDADGTTARPNLRGLVLTNSSNNVIGGTSAAARNVISGNAASAIDITGSGNVIQGNFIGTNAAGTAQLSQPGGIGILDAASANNLIGGTAPGAGNLISGNQFGISTSGGGTVIQGNLIGTDVSGTKKIPNGTRGIGALGENILIGGLTPGARNVISGNADGVLIRGAGSRVQGNFIGTDITGTLALGNNGNGVTAGDTALIGGTVPEARNIISANGGFGNVVLGQNNSGSAATVRGNYIGTDVTGTRALGNLSNGINIISNNNIIGGLVAGARNVVSGNSAGIVISGFSGGSQGNVIQGNFIGLDAAGTGPVPNTQQGIVITGAVSNTIGGTQSEAANKIAYNGGPGISITNGVGITIRGNSIFSNNGLGIDLGGNGVTANDSSDGDSGPNVLQNFPVLTTVMSTSNSTTIQGSLNSVPNTTFQIDFYSNAAVDPSGHGEGAQFFGTTPVTTNGNGDATINATFPVALATGRVISATATDPNGNTSEFSAVDSTTASGSLQFTIGSIQLIEDIGTLTLTVQRTGGATGNLSVDFSTADGTALAGQDFTSTSGTLNFIAGETSKTIQIPITDDATSEPFETFTVALRHDTSPETVGAPSTVFVTLLDRSTTPLLSIGNVSVVEGNSGSTTDLVFTINLSAATGRTVTGNFVTTNISAFGGASCATQGADYESRTGTFSFTPGTTTFTIPIKICGDTSAEADELFRVLLTSPSGAAFQTNNAFGGIVNDDMLELVLEESGPTPNQAAVLDSILAVRDPFRVIGLPDWVTTGADRNTRIVLFARNLQLNPGESASAVSVRFIASSNQFFQEPAIDVRPVANSDLTQVTVRLPDNLSAGNCTVTILAHTRESNPGTIRIAP